MDGPIIEPNKCQLCGKSFGTARDFDRHKNRKTPCVIREVPEDQRNNPNRCIHCNKIFVQKQSLTRHLGLCKFKNRVIQIPDEKIRHEQEIRVIMEKQDIDNKAMVDLIAGLTNELAEVKKKLFELEARPATNITNNVKVGNIQVGNVVFSNYDSPCAADLKITSDDLHESNLLGCIIRKVFFNPERPQNHVILKPNPNDDLLIVHKDGNWIKLSGQATTTLLRTLKTEMMRIGIEALGRSYPRYSDFIALDEAARKTKVSFENGKEHGNINDADILTIMHAGSGNVAPTMRENVSKKKLTILGIRY